MRSFLIAVGLVIWFVAAWWFVFAAWCPRRLPRALREDALFPDLMSEGKWALPGALATTSGMCGYRAVTAYEKWPNSVTAGATVASFAVLALSLLLFATLWRFERPRMLVPPDLRQAVLALIEDDAEERVRPPGGVLTFAASRRIMSIRASMSLGLVVLGALLLVTPGVVIEFRLVGLVLLAACSYLSIRLCELWWDPTSLSIDDAALRVTQRAGTSEFRWHDIVDVGLSMGLLGAQVSLRLTRPPGGFTPQDLPTTSGGVVYRIPPLETIGSMALLPLLERELSRVRQAERT